MGGPAAVALLLVLAACAPAGPQPPPQVAVNFVTDPVTGHTDGPFDPATGLRVLTQTGEDGVLRVVLDSTSLTPVLLNEQAMAPPPAPVVVAPPPAASAPAPPAPAKAKARPRKPRKPAPRKPG